MRSRRRRRSSRCTNELSAACQPHRSFRQRSIAGGDFHPGNILSSSRGPVVIDWPNVTRGDADADLARTMLMLQLGSIPPGSPIVIRVGSLFARRLLRIAYVRGYRGRRTLDAAQVRRWMALRAIDRLTENIVEERKSLLRVIERAMSG
jgi:aminoglycoside phosphotransferase (APT) family kinase protein